MNILIKDNMCTIYKVILHRVQRYLQQNGHEIVSTAEHAEVVIVGLCAGFEADENRSIQLIRTYDTSQKPLIAYGCLTQVAPETEWGGVH